MSEEEVLNHWRFFISLEKDFVSIGDYIEINQDNYKSYSFELSKILQLSCSEIDCVCRLLCKELDPNTDYQDQDIFSGNIAQYKRTILRSLPRIVDAEFFIRTIGDSAIRPWRDWQRYDSPSWWKGYNKVKHYRHVCFREASLKNSIDAMGALMIAVYYLYRLVSGRPSAIPDPAPKLFISEYTGSVLASSGKELPGFE